MAIKGINFKSLLVAGLVAGWMMYFIDHWFAGFIGLFGIFPGPSNWGWMLTHHVESVIFAIPFAWPAMYNKLPGSGWFKGAVYGFLWWLVFLVIVALIAGSLLGAKPIAGYAPTSFVLIVNGFLLHVFWGFFLGALYNPLDEAAA